MRRGGRRGGPAGGRYPAPRGRRAPPARGTAPPAQAAEQTPASLRPRLARRDGLSSRRRTIERASDTEPDATRSVAVAPRLRRSAVRAERVSLVPTLPTPAALEPAPSRTARRGRPSRAAVRAEAMRDALRVQRPAHDVRAASRPAAASAIDSSVETTAKSGGAGASGPSTWKLIAPLRPVLPAASDWRGGARVVLPPP